MISYRPCGHRSCDIIHRERHRSHENCDIISKGSGCTLWSAGACAAPWDAPTKRDRTAAHPTTHGSQTGRVDITAAISCTGKEITATKTEISASTKVISSTVPRRQRAAKAVTSNGPASPSASPQKYQAQGALKTLVNCTCALLRSALLREASRFVSLFIKFAFK